LQEAVINLLDNAVKYNTHATPQIRVRLLPHRDDGGGVTILVEDNGPGIVAQEAAAVFERGYRGSRNINGTVDIKPGSGLGLTIARSLVEQMGGTLRWVPPMTYPHSLGGTAMELKVFRKRANHRPTASSSPS
jgi:two-component system, OmpR family, sensor histidine kinase TctE